MQQKQELQEIALELSKYFATDYKVRQLEERKVLIIAGNAGQANYYARIHGWKNWKYISNYMDMRAENNVRIVRCGSWFQRMDWNRLLEEVDYLISHGRAEEIFVREE